MTVGLAPRQADLLRGSAAACEGRVAPNSIWAVLHRECHRLFPDQAFADLFDDRGRRSIPPRIVAVVMVLQRLFGLSDREAVEAFAFDARWKYACGGLEFDHPGFVHTVLVDMRARLDRSENKNRIFDVTVEAAHSAGLVGARRVLDSTPLYDAVATMDTITLIRSAIRALLGVAEPALEASLRAALRSGDDYASASKPHVDWDDKEEREALIDSRAKDAFACLGVLDGRPLDAEVSQAATLVATVVGQDLDQGDDGVFRIARKVAPDRIISTVDPEARHGHKTAARGFDGYKGHVSVEPDSEIIVETVVSAGNVGDASAAAELLAECLPDGAANGQAVAAGAPATTETDDAAATEVVTPETDDDETATVVATETDETAPAADEVNAIGAASADAEPATTDVGSAEEGAAPPETTSSATAIAVYGDAAYGAGELLELLEAAGADVMVKVQPPVNRNGLFAKDRFLIDLEAMTVTCPNGVTVDLRQRAVGGGRRRSPAPARAVRWPPTAPPPWAVARSTSGLTKPSCLVPGPAKPTRHGLTTTGPPVPRWSASSVTSCAESTGDEGRGSEGGPRSPPTSRSWLLPSIWPALARSGCTRLPVADGRWQGDRG